MLRWIRSKDLKTGVEIVSDAGMTVAFTIAATLAGLTSYGIYVAFGPPSKKLTDSFDEHDD